MQGFSDWDALLAGVPKDGDSLGEEDSQTKMWDKDLSSTYTSSLIAQDVSMEEVEAAAKKIETVLKEFVKK